MVKLIAREFNTKVFILQFSQILVHFAKYWVNISVKKYLKQSMYLAQECFDNILHKNRLVNISVSFGPVCSYRQIVKLNNTHAASWELAGTTNAFLYFQYYRNIEYMLWSAVYSVFECIEKLSFRSRVSTILDFYNEIYCIFMLFIS